MKFLASNFGPFLIIGACIAFCVAKSVPWLFSLIFDLVCTNSFVIPLAVFAIISPYWKKCMEQRIHPLLYSVSVIINAWTLCSLALILGVQIIWGVEIACLCATIIPVILCGFVGDNEMKPWHIKSELWQDVIEQFFIDPFDKDEIGIISSRLFNDLSDFELHLNEKVVLGPTKAVAQKCWDEIQTYPTSMNKEKLDYARSHYSSFNSVPRNVSLGWVDDNASWKFKSYQKEGEKFEKELNIVRRNWFMINANWFVNSMMRFLVNSVAPDAASMMQVVQNIASIKHVEEESKKPLFYLKNGGIYHPIFNDMILLMKLHCIYDLSVPVQIIDFSFEQGSMTLRYKPFGCSKTYTIHPTSANDLYNHLEYLDPKISDNFIVYKTFYMVQQKLVRMIYKDNETEENPFFKF